MAIRDEFAGVFDFIREDAVGQALQRELPLVGAALQTLPTGALGFFSSLESQIDAALASASNTAQSIADALNAIPGITASVVGDAVTIVLAASDTTLIDVPDGAIDIGTDKLRLTADAVFDATVSSQLAVTLSFDTGTGALTLVDTADDELTLGLDVFADVNATAALGPVGFKVTDGVPDGTPEIALDFGVDFDSLADLDIEVSATGAVQLALGLETTASTDILPTFYADLVLDWDFSDLTVPAPTIVFEDVGVELGSLVDTVADAISPITDIFGREPFKSIIDTLTEPLPILDEGLRALGLTDLFDIIPDDGDGVVNLPPGSPDGDGTLNLLDLAGQWFAYLGDEENLNRLSKFAEALSVIKQLTDLAEQGVGGLGRLSLGRFDLNGDTPAFDLGTLTPESIQAAADQLLGENNVFSDTVGAIAGVIREGAESALKKGGLGGTSGLSVPLLEDPADVVKIFLPQFYADPTVTIVEYDIPDLVVDFHFNEFFRIFGPFGLTISGDFEAGIDFSIGYDTTALTTPGGEFVDGLFIGTPPLVDPVTGETRDIPHRPDNLDSNGQPIENLPIGYLYGRLAAGAAVDVVLLRAGVEGGILGTVHAFIPNGELRLEDLEQACIFDPIEGRLAADISVQVKAGLGPFSVSKTFVIAEVTLADFSYGCNADGSTFELGLATPNGSDLILNAGPRAMLRSADAAQGQDTGEVFRVRNALVEEFGEEDVPVPGALGVSAFGVEQVFGSADAPFDRIVANMGAGHDILFLDAAVAQGALANGSVGNDFLSGALGNDSFDGGSGIDVLRGYGGDDLLEGGDDDDVLEGGAGRDTLVGGAGVDQVSYEKSEAAVIFDFNATEPYPGGFPDVIGFRGKGGEAEGDLLVGIEYIVGSNFNDEIRGNLIAGNTLEGLAGNDALTGGFGQDYILGGAGGDHIDGREARDGTSYLTSQGAVRIDLQSGAASGGEAQGDRLISIEDVQGSEHDDVLRGTGGANLIDGLFGDDIVEGRGGADTLLGGDGDDTIRGGADGDDIDGGRGRDLLTYSGISGRTAGVDLKNSAALFFIDGIVQTAVAGYSTIEDLEGTNNVGAGDALTGDLGYNVIRGLAGNDAIDGDGGNDTLVGGAGADALTGGLGLDLADYDESISGVTVNLALGTGLGGDAEGDTLAGIENLRGSSSVDLLTGDDVDNEIDPGLSSGGIDTVAGGAGTDTLVINYSAGTYGRGMVGGFNSGSITTGAFTGRDSAGTVLDGVDFTGVQKLRLIGTFEGDEIYGGAGDDFIETGGGADAIVAGRGNDRVYAGDGDDTVASGTAVSRALSTSTSATSYVLDLVGGRGTDTLSISLAGEQGPLILTGGTPGSEFSGVNLRTVGGGAVREFELLGDVITGFGNDAVTQAGAVDNRFTGGWGQDTFRPGLGVDVVDGGYDFQDGNEVAPRPGFDDAYVVEDEAAFHANLGDFLVLDYSSFAGTGGVTSTVNAVRSDFLLYQGSPRPIITPLVTNEGTYGVGPAGDPASSSVDFSEIERVNIKGSNQADRLIGTHNTYGFVDDGVAVAASGSILPAHGGDVLDGQGGNDTITGNSGDDTILGGDGDDILNGTDPSFHDEERADPFEIDLLTGGAGADRFVLGVREGSLYTADQRDIYVDVPGGGTNSSRAIVTDFKPGDGDLIQLHGSAADYAFRTTTDGATLISYTAGDYGDQRIADVLNFTGFELSANYVRYVNPLIVIPGGGVIPVPGGNVGRVAGLAADDLEVQSAALADGPEAATLATPPESGAEAFPISAPPAAPISLAAAEVTPLAAPWVTRNSNPDELLEALFPGGAGTGINLATDSLKLKGDARAFGTFSGDPFGLGSGIVLSTGQVADLAGANAIDGIGPPAIDTTLSFDPIGTFGGSTIYRADLSELGIDINSLTLRDSGSREGGASGRFSGFDLDALVLSTTRLEAGVTNATDLNGAALPRLDAFDFSAAGIRFTPGTQRPTDDPTLQGSDMNGVVNGLVGTGLATLNTFDATGSTGAVGSRFTLGDNGALQVDLKAPVSTDGPLYLYVGESGISDDETLSGQISVSSERIEADSDLSTDFGLPGVANDTISLTYTFETLPGAAVDTAFFDFAFFSEELPEFGGSEFNDRFKILLNGVNLAELSDGTAASVNTLRAGRYGPSSPDLIFNPVGTGPAQAETRADAYTNALTFAGALDPDGTNTLTIEVADVRDGLLDSGILVRAGTLRAGAGPGGIVITPPTGPNGEPPTVTEGGGGIVIPVTIDPGASGALTEPVTLTFMPGPAVDLGNGPGAPVVVTVNPGGPLTFELPVQGAGGGTPDTGGFGVIGVETQSADPNYDGLPIAPIVVEILPDMSGPAAPTVALASDTGVSASDRLTSNPALVFGAEAGATLAYAVDGGAFSATAPIFAVDGTQDGLRTVAVRATDVSGNVSPETTFAFTLDTVAPTPTIGAVAGDDVVSASEAASGFQVSGSAVGAEDGQPVQLTLQTGSGAVVASAEIPATANAFAAASIGTALAGVPDGPYGLVATVADRAGNVGSPATRTVVLDRTPPAVVTVDAAPSDGKLISGDTVLFQVLLSEPVEVAGSGLELQLSDGGTATYLSGSGTATLVFSHTILPGQSAADLAVVGVTLGRATVRDGAGNLADLAGAIRNPAGVLIVAPNGAPIAVDDTASVAEDASVSGNLAGNDTASPDGGNVYALATGPANGIASVDARGGFIYTPHPNFNGADAFVYRLTDGDGTASTATVSLTVAAVEDAPMAVADTATTFGDAPVTVAVAANDDDGDPELAQTLAVTGASSAEGDVTLADNLITFEPGANFSGEARVEYTLSDGAGGTAAGILTIAVIGPTPGPDDLAYGNRANVINALPGDDTLRAGGGADRIDGGDGNDLLFGQDGDDEVHGNEGDDRLEGEGGNDRLGGGHGNDRLAGDGGEDRMYGGTGDDTLFGDAGNDELSGENGQDVLEGGDGDDRLFGNDGDDVLRGNDGNDLLVGDDGKDRLEGGNGNDRLEGGANDDVLHGGAGSDTFVFDANFRSDRIEDFASEDVIELSAGRFSSFAAVMARASQAGGDTLIQDDGGQNLTLQGVSLTSLQADDFRFV